MDTFDEKLLLIIDKTLKYVFGNINTEIIYDYMEKKGCSLQEIPSKLELFSRELENLVGSSRGQLLGVAPILEETILKGLCAELNIEFDKKSPVSFANCVNKLKEDYTKKEAGCVKKVSQEQSTKICPVPDAITPAGERR